MAFDSLSEKLQGIFKNLRGKGRLSEADVKAALKEVKMALLEADVNFRVVKNFVKTVEERAIGQDVMSSLTPGQMVIKIVNEEMVALLGSETTELTFLPGNEITVIMMCGLQGAGKTTMAAKLAGQFKSKGKRPLLVACDVYRPAAIDQLIINGEKVGVPVFTMGDKNNPVDIAKAALEHAKKNNNNVVLVDTAGRLHIDEVLMEELKQIKEALNVTNTLLTVDAMTGQDAVNVAETFEKEIGITGVVITKLDGDTRGGAALSIRAVTGRPILFAGTGEKGMGDILTLIDKAQAEFDMDKAKEMEKKLKKAEFDFNDLLEQTENMKKMGGINSIMSMLPGVGSQLKGVELNDDMFKGMIAIIRSMTPEERSNPALLNPSRKRRIAAGAGVDISEVNRLVKQVEGQKKMMKQLSGMMGGKGRRGFKMPFGF